MMGSSKDLPLLKCILIIETRASFIDLNCCLNLHWPWMACFLEKQPSEVFHDCIWRKLEFLRYLSYGMTGSFGPANLLCFCEEFAGP